MCDEVVDSSTVHPLSFRPDGLDHFFARKYTVRVVHEELHDSEFHGCCGNDGDTIHRESRALPGRAEAYIRNCRVFLPGLCRLRVKESHKKATVQIENFGDVVQALDSNGE